MEIQRNVIIHGELFVLLHALQERIRFYTVILLYAGCGAFIIDHEYVSSHINRTEK